MEPPQNPGGIKHPVGHLLGAAQPALLPPASQVPAETAVGVGLELVERLGRMGVGVVVHPAPQPVVDLLHHLAEALASPLALRQHRPHPLPGSLARLRGREDVRDVSSVLSRHLPLEAERSEEHTSELQSRPHLVCRLLLEKKKNTTTRATPARDSDSEN